MYMLLSMNKLYFILYDDDDDDEMFLWYDFCADKGL